MKEQNRHKMVKALLVKFRCKNFCVSFHKNHDIIIIFTLLSSKSLIKNL